VADLPGPEGVSITHGGVGGLEVAMHRSGTGVIAVIRDTGAEPEADRLGNELRTTIEELLRARRTIELQRGELERSATVDALTGVASRGSILERLRIEVAEARRYHHPLAVVLLDVDRFGEINRVHGIRGGDSVLREVALRMRLRVREADALGRAGSDGFLAALPHTDEAGAATFADALRHRLALRPVAIGSEAVAVTISIGVATMRPGEDLDLDGLLARVQEALDSARAAGGNRIALDRLHGLARLEDPHEKAEDPGSESDASG
jgi:diguanylate cyclase (GGDEF)-like protein